SLRAVAADPAPGARRRILLGLVGRLHDGQAWVRVAGAEAGDGGPAPGSGRRPVAARRTLEPGIEYVRLERMDAAGVYMLLPDLRAARGVVFDLRDCTEAPEEVPAHLIDAPVSLCRLERPVVGHPDPARATWSEVERRLLPATPRISAPVVFLAAGGTRGAAELLLAVVRDAHLGTIVGATSAGACGDLLQVALPGDAVIGFTGLRVTALDGSPIIGRGIDPDVPVAPTPTGAGEGADAALAAALALLRDRK
ncbi:MAG: hypothetical protein HZA54_20330, partial [Planctomycetes bacterium]|nr:hypothetical protein [Planctomycetota bacterium]